MLCIEVSKIKVGLNLVALQIVSISQRDRLSI